MNMKKHPPLNDACIFSKSVCKVGKNTHPRRLIKKHLGIAPAVRRENKISECIYGQDIPYFV